MNRIYFSRYVCSYYKILNVTENATQQDIKKNYLFLAKKYHPDSGEISSSEFLKIQEAYDILKNPETRKKYDYEFNNSQNQPHPQNYYYYRDDNQFNHDDSYDVRKLAYRFVSFGILGVIVYVLSKFFRPMTEHQVFRQNIILANENIDSSPSAQEKRRKQYAQEMIDKKITSNVKIMKVWDGSAESTKSKNNRKKNIDSIPGVCKEKPAAVVPLNQQEYI